MGKLPDLLEFRKADHPIDDLFLRRWSPRAMSGAALPEAQLLTLLEAARWAPSTYNEQEWRFLYSMRDTEAWGVFLDLLAEANQTWCRQASALVVVLSHKVMTRNGNPNPVHSFDAGAAFQNVGLQGTIMNLVVHGMAGFDREKARNRLDIPDDYAVEAMIAIGQPGDPSELAEELQPRETPSGRKPLAEIACAGKFSFGK